MQLQDQSSLSGLQKNGDLTGSPKPIEPQKSFGSFLSSSKNQNSNSSNQSQVNSLSQYFKNGISSRREIDNKISRTSSNFNPDKNEVFKSLEGLVSTSSAKKELLKKVQKEFGNKKITTEDLLGFFSESVDPTKNRDFRKAEEFIEKNFGVKKDVLNSYGKKMASQKERIIQQEKRVISSKKEAFQTLKGIGKGVGDNIKNSLSFNRISGPGSSISGYTGSVRGSKFIKLANKKI